MFGKRGHHRKIIPGKQLCLRRIPHPAGYQRNGIAQIHIHNQVVVYPRPVSIGHIIQIQFGVLHKLPGRIFFQAVHLRIRSLQQPQHIAAPHHKLIHFIFLLVGKRKARTRNNQYLHGIGYAGCRIQIHPHHVILPGRQGLLPV